MHPAEKQAILVAVMDELQTAQNRSGGLPIAPLLVSVGLLAFAAVWWSLSTNSESPVGNTLPTPEQGVLRFAQVNWEGRNPTSSTINAFIAKLTETQASVVAVSGLPSRASTDALHGKLGEKWRVVAMRSENVLKKEDGQSDRADDWLALLLHPLVNLRARHLIDGCEACTALAVTIDDPRLGELHVINAPAPPLDPSAYQQYTESLRSWTLARSASPTILMTPITDQNKKTARDRVVCLRTLFSAVRSPQGRLTEATRSEQIQTSGFRFTPGRIKPARALEVPWGSERSPLFVVDIVRQ